MRRHLASILVLTSLLTLLPCGVLLAGPQDARVGELRAVYKPEGTALRTEPKALSAAVVTLPSGQQVIVREVKLPWLKVCTAVPRGQASCTGWLRAFETVEPAALRANPRPAGTLQGATTGVSQRDISVAGRQLGPATEQGYRQSRPDLGRAYMFVDQMEAATAQLVPAESVAFIVRGALGRSGQDYVRPPLLQPEQARPPTQRPSRGPNPGKILGGLGGGLLDKLGGGGRTGDLVRSGVTELAGLTQQVNQKFTPAQEYYLGRAVAANAIAKYGVDPSENRRKYVRQVGDAVVRLTTRLPSNYGGYHFEVLDSDEVNGVSGPGGFVLLTRGAVEACEREDELAAVICHELAHIKLQHGERTLRSGKDFQAAVGALSRFGAKAGGVDNNAVAGEIVKFFSTAVGEMARTSMEHNYGRGAEFQADLEGTYLLVDVVYDHAAMRDLLRRLVSIPGAYGQAATHSPAQVRVQQLDPLVARYGPFQGARALEARRNRLATRLGRAVDAPR